MNKIKTLAVITPGGDAPGKNAAIRAVTLTAIKKEINVLGVQYGYQGLIDDSIIKLNAETVRNIIGRSGTILKSTRCEDFKTKQGHKKALHTLKKNKIDAVIIIGGNGSLQGAIALSKLKIPCIVIPATIDRDVYGTDRTIGFDTAVNTAVQAIDKIMDTAEAFNRLFFVEVMGRHAGTIALMSGLSTGAEAILIPEKKTDLEQLVKKIKNDFKTKKHGRVIIVAEGDDAGNAFTVAGKVRDKIKDVDIKVSVLGHMQRGGSVLYYDRVLAGTLGVSAVNMLVSGKRNVMLAIKNDLIKTIKFKDVKIILPSIDKKLLYTSELLAQ